ncbi:MAG: M3 family oligoendopeptidase [Treponema sp.]|nr:M3 family oligoendopeptidase [Treponema sp.]
MNELNTPRWNLDKLFSSIESDKYKQAVELLKTGIEKLESLLKNSGRFNFSFWLNGYLTAYDKVYALMQTLSCYASIIYSVDTTNSAVLNNLSVIDEFGIQFSQIDVSFKSILYKHRDELDAFFLRFPQFADRKYLLELDIAEFKHQMPPKEELLTSSLQKTGGNAWELLQAQIISNLADEKGKTFNELRNDAYSSDPALRKSSYEKELALLKANRIALAACLNNLKGETVYLNKRRKWRSAIDRALLANRLSKPTLNALIRAIEKSLPAFRKYFLAKAKYLKKHNMSASFSADKGLAFYDLFAPMENPSEVNNDKNSILTKTWTFDEARDYIIARYTSFSVHMGSFAKKAFEENWIDAEVRAGKVGGAFDEDFSLGHQSRILTNFTGTFSDIITLAHELGHAYHFSCLKGKPPVFASYPMTLAETASTFAETIVKQDLLSKCTPAERLQLLDIDLQDVSQVLVDILCRYYFEKSVFTEREKNPLTADDFCRLMQAAQEKSYGKGLNSERHEYMWAVKSHYYSTGLDFYNFPYAFGQLFAMALYRRYKKEGAGFAATYAKLLSNTGAMSCEDLCREAGFDITQVEFWQNGIQAYLEEVDEFIALANEKGESAKQA